MTIEQAKAHLRMSQATTPLDGNITDSIDAATEQVERDIDRPMMVQSFVYKRYGFPPRGGVMRLPLRPIQSITQIDYQDENDATQVLSTDVYGLDSGRRHIYLKPGQSWPSVTPQPDAVSVTYDAGYTDADDLPRVFRQMILLQVGKWHRDPAMEDTSARDDVAYERLVQKHIATFWPTASE